jgi:diguanylate cyclase (GGDEF)-like protein/PAS domain S-box-containing protein
MYQSAFRIRAPGFSMNLRRRILLLSGLVVVALTLIVGLSTNALVSRHFARAESHNATETASRVRRLIVTLGYAKVSKNLLLFTGSLNPDVLQRVGRAAGAQITQRSDGANLPSDWSNARERLKTEKSGVLSLGATSNSVIAWISGRDRNGKTVLLRIAVPQRLESLRRPLSIALIGALILGGLLLGTGTMLVIDRLVLQRLQERLSDQADASGSLSLSANPDVSGIRTELESAQRAGRESEELFRQMAINASDVLYAMYPETGRIDWFGQIDFMLGYANGSFPRTIDAWAEHIHPDEAAHIIALYSQTAQTAEPFAVEYRMRHRNGSYRYWSHRGRPLFNAKQQLVRVIGACTDVTEQRRAEMRLRESEEKLTRIFETAADAILICDSNAKITYANPAAETVFGAGRDDIVGSTYDGIAGFKVARAGYKYAKTEAEEEPGSHWKIAATGGEDLPNQQWPSVWAIASGEAVYHIEHMVEQANGRIVVVSVNAAPLLDAEGQVTGAVLSISDVTGRKALEEKLAFQAFHDPLTGLPNRALFTDRLEHAMVRAARNKTGIAVFFIDLDNFKKTNDTLGHDAGDALLKATAARLKSCVRGADTAARLAGDEFTLLLDSVDDLAGAIVVADRVLETMLECVEIKGEMVYAPPSIGIALGKPDDQPADVLKRADAAMYWAKQNGKARYEVWDESMVAETTVVGTTR